MDFQDLKHLSEIPENELTAKLIALFGIITMHHDHGKGLAPFSWQNLVSEKDGSLCLINLTETNLTEDVRLRNYSDYAGIIYCICAKKKSAESMSWDGGRKIKQPVLREIVLTICGRNDSIEPLIVKLRQPYINEDTFFSNYTTVDEKEASENYAKSIHIRTQNIISDNEAEYERRQRALNPWYKGIGSFLLIGLCFYGYRACKNSESYQNQQDTQLIRQMMHHTPKPRPILPLNKLDIANKNSLKAPKIPRIVAASAGTRASQADTRAAAAQADTTTESR